MNSELHDLLSREFLLFRKIFREKFLRRMTSEGVRNNFLVTARQPVSCRGTARRAPTCSQSTGSMLEGGTTINVNGDESMPLRSEVSA